MNKRTFLLIFLFLLSIIAQENIFAQETPGIKEAPLVKDIQEGHEKIQEIQEQQDKTAYLKQEWEKILSKNKGGKILIKISDIVKIFSPIFKIVLGVEYSLSWSFLFAVVVWTALFIFLVHPFTAFFGSTNLGILGGFLTASLIGLSGIIKKSVELLSFILNNFWIAILSFIIAIILALVFERLGMKLKKKIIRQKEEAERERTERSRKIISTIAETHKKEF
ncbi:MAG: hypothetical protein AABX73_03125 [Nanoarchaeota archaeon]